MTAMSEYRSMKPVPATAPANAPTKESVANDSLEATELLFTSIQASAPMKAAHGPIAMKASGE
jgi:hypothetical protein